MKSLINRSISEFIPIELSKKEVREEIFWGEENISGSLTLLALEPVLFGIWSTGPLQKNNPSLTIKLEQKILVEIHGSSEKIIKLASESLVLWKPDSTRLFTMNFKEKFIELIWMLKKSRKSKFTFSKKSISHLAASYFYPRKIYIVVVKTDHFLNIFPMDLHTQYPDRDSYAFALQPGNSAEAVIKECGKVLVCEIASDQLGFAYKLGKNHGKTNLYDKELPFSTTDSELFNFPVPDNCIGYKEIQVENNLSLGSHTLFLGKQAFVKEVPDNAKQPYHIHRFHYRYCISKNLLDKATRLNIS